MNQLYLLRSFSSLRLSMMLRCVFFALYVCAAFTLCAQERIYNNDPRYGAGWDGELYLLPVYPTKEYKGPTQTYVAYQDSTEKYITLWNRRDSLITQGSAYRHMEYLNRYRSVTLGITREQRERVFALGHKYFDPLFEVVDCSDLRNWSTTYSEARVIDINYFCKRDGKIVAFEIGLPRCISITPELLALIEEYERELLSQPPLVIFDVDTPYAQAILRMYKPQYFRVDSGIVDPKYVSE